MLLYELPSWRNIVRGELSKTPGEHGISVVNLNFNSMFSCTNIQDEVFKNRPSKICGRQPLKNLKGCSMLKQTISLQKF